jgi:hypothetical protein
MTDGHVSRAEARRMARTAASVGAGLVTAALAAGGALGILVAWLAGA